MPEHQTAPEPSATSGPPADTLREIIETVVFVVVLVLLLKSFVAEAFVIPTGSMATTLWGYQKVVDCPECGYRFPVNCASEADPQDGQAPEKVLGCTCPNCRYSIDFEAEARNRPGWSVPGWTSGDRVLVAKYFYDLLGRQPERLDVVVFKFPGDDGRIPWPQSGPYRNHVPMNYIKRLIGLPDEVIAVHGGDLYRIPAGKLPDEVRQALAADAAASRREDAQQLWQLHYTRSETGANAREFFAKYRDLFQIIRKPPETVLSMRRIVYDNDYPARDLTGERWERWGGDGWSASGRGFGHAGAGATTDWLTYRHVLRTYGKPSLVTDFMGYNSEKTARGDRTSGVNWVRDLMLECDVAVDKAEGGLTLELGRGADRFEARFDLATGTCTLVRLTDAGEQEIGRQATAVNKPGSYRLRFADFDDRLTVWVDNALPFGEGVAFAPPSGTAPTRENDLEHPAGVGARGAAARVSHLRLWRDTYYTVGAVSPSDPDVQRVDWADPQSWGGLAELPVRTMVVQPGHFLCLGDNSPASSDGRTWGLVPERLLLGRALVVYYPFSRAGMIH